MMRLSATGLLLRLKLKLSVVPTLHSQANMDKPLLAHALPLTVLYFVRRRPKLLVVTFAYVGHILYKAIS
jgi:hypothetical protein